MVDYSSAVQVSTTETTATISWSGMDGTYARVRTVMWFVRTGSTFSSGTPLTNGQFDLPAYATSGQFTVSGLSAGTTYSVWVSIWNPDGEQLATATYNGFQTTQSVTYVTIGVTAGTGISRVYINGAGSSSYKSATVESGSSVVLSCDVADGYTFDGWYEGSTKYSSSQTYTPNTAYDWDLVAKAVLAAKTYTLTYNANGGSGAPSAGSATGTGDTLSLTISTTEPTRTGYTFLGWADSSTATAAAYQPGDTISLSGNKTIYAVWSVNTYTVKYYSNTTDAVSNLPASQTKTYGVALTLSSNTPTREGYTFLGWATSSSSTTVAYAPGASYTVNAAANLYAVWKYNDLHLFYGVGGAWKAADLSYGVGGVWKDASAGYGIGGVWKKSE